MDELEAKFVDGGVKHSALAGSGCALMSQSEFGFHFQRCSSILNNGPTPLCATFGNTHIMLITEML